MYSKTAGLDKGILLLNLSKTVAVERFDTIQVTPRREVRGRKEI